MRAAKTSQSLSARAGLTLVEVLFAASITAVVLLGAVAMMRRDGELSEATIKISVAETKAQEVLYTLSRELADAAGGVPSTQLSNGLGTGVTQSVSVGSTQGFPPVGTLLVDRGTGSVERVGYDALGGATSFLGLARGASCTQDTSHAAGGSVLWAGAASALPSALQQNPSANLFDGRALILGTPTYYQGDGTGFSYRVPVDPTGSTPPNYVVNGQIQWGASWSGNSTTSGWNALYWQPRYALDEATSGTDLNGDGDAVDVFDVGQIRRVRWDASNPGGPAAPQDTGIGPSVVLQERCNHGGDLDGDGFEDPIFLWNDETHELFVRVFVVGLSSGNVPIVRRAETLVYLRNQLGT